MNHLEWVAIVTAVVAVYGAVLSTYNLIAARRDRAHKLRVSLKWGIAAPGPEPETMLILEATNPRGRPVTVAACGIALPNGKTLIIPQWMRHTAAAPLSFRVMPQKRRRCYDRGTEMAR